MLSRQINYLLGLPVSPLSNNEAQFIAVPIGPAELNRMRPRVVMTMTAAMLIRQTINLYSTTVTPR